jgi:hypothetical protein
MKKRKVSLIGYVKDRNWILAGLDKNMICVAHSCIMTKKDTWGNNYKVKVTIEDL